MVSLCYFLALLWAKEVLFIFPAISTFLPASSFDGLWLALEPLTVCWLQIFLESPCLDGQFLLHRLSFHIAIVLNLKLYNCQSNKCHQGKITLSTPIFREEVYILYSLIQRWLYTPKTNSIFFTFSMLCFTHPLLSISLDLLGGCYDLVISMPSVTKAQSVCTLEENQKNL